MSAAEKWVYDNSRPTALTVPGRVFRAVHHLVLVSGVGAMVLATHEPVAAAHATLLALAFNVALGFFAVEYVVRLYAAAASLSAEPTHPWTARWEWATSLNGLIDLAAVLPFVLAGLLAWNPATINLFAIVWVLKLFRYSPGSGMLQRVLRDARESLFSVFVAFIVVLLVAATLMHVFEGPGQPKLYGSIPAALWWGITTLTTTGYGDVVPVSPLGRLVAGMVMICGIAVFALWAGILANAFANEVRRREFLRNWDLITKVPFFRDLGAATIADIAQILKPQAVEKGRTIIRRGDPGDCMFFIVSGEVEVRLAPEPRRLGPGGFFGEIALITGEPRSATAVAAKETQLLVLDIADFRQLTARRPELANVVTEEGLRRMERVRQSRGGGQ
ncbi:MAG: cyclic nucleotide-binding domain-containing protein [Rhodospirillales bacterium]|nr:cyclic nucleotide-binding domain-containing protein [Rhodospirillales bacterium]